MDGDLRYAAIREHITAQHEIARVERSARVAAAARASRARSQSSDDDAGFSSGLAAVVGSMRNRVTRRALGA